MSRSLTLLTLLVLGSAACPLTAQQTSPIDDSYRFNIESGLRQHTDPLIQADLKLTDEQKAKIAKIPADLLAKNKDAIEKEKTADKAAAEKRAAVAREFDKKGDSLIEKHLTADQRTRLDQMVLQGMHLGAFNDPAVAKALALPEDYRSKMDTIRDAENEKLRKAFPNFAPFNADAEMRQKYIEAQRKSTRQMVAAFVDTFTGEQKKAWKTLVGEPSEVALNHSGVDFGGASSFRSTVQAALLQSDKALAELKIEKPARQALAQDWTALLIESRQAGVGPFTGGFGANTTLIAIGGEATRLADEVLTPPQAKRLEQIRFQIRGTSVFFATGGGGPVGLGGPVSLPPNPLLKLMLTPAQVVKADSAITTAIRKRQQLAAPRFGGFGIPETDEQKKARAVYQEKVTRIDNEALADILATFDAGQKAAWKEMTGEPIDVSKLTQVPTPFRGFGGPISPKGQNATVVALWAREATLRMQNGEYAAALAAYDQAIRLAPTNKAYLLQKANLLATCPSEWVRDGKQAVELMQKVMEGVELPNYALHAAMAAAFAEAGQFDEAVKSQEKANAVLAQIVAQQGQSGFFFPTEQFEERLKLYRDKKPYRMPEPKAGGFGGPGGQ